MVSNYTTPGNLRGNAGIVFQQGDVGLQALAPG